MRPTPASLSEWKENTASLAHRSLMGSGLALWALLVWMLVGNRVTLQLSTGGRGTLAVLDLALIFVGLTIWVTSGRNPNKVVPAHIYWRSAGPLYVLLLLLPVLGVLGGSYELRSLYAWAGVLVSWSIFMIGRVARDPRSWRRVAFVAIVGHGMYGVGQLLSRASLLPAAIAETMQSWDRQSQASYAASYVVSQRSTGLFVNPNSFGMWSACAIIFAIFFLRGWMRLVASILGVAGIVASGSRTAAVAVVVAVIAMALSGRGVQGAFKVVGAAAGSLAIGGLLVWLGVIDAVYSEEARERVSSGVAAILGQGSDVNLAGRIEVWRSAADLAGEQWLGTWGPPQLALQQSIDNQYVAFFLQGSVPMCGAFLLLLASPTFVLNRNDRRPFLIFSAVVATMSMTAMAIENAAALALIWIGLVITLLPDATSADQSAGTRQSLGTSSGRGVSA